MICARERSPPNPSGSKQIRIHICYMERRGKKLPEAVTLMMDEVNFVAKECNPPAPFSKAGFLCVCELKLFPVSFLLECVRKYCKQSHAILMEACPWGRFRR